MFMQLLDKVSSGNDAIGSWVGRVMSAVDKILVPVLIIACSVGMIWAIVVGIKMMKADDKSARDENKAKLINIAISIVAVAVLIGLFYALRNWLDDTSKTGNDFNIFDKTEGGEGSSVVGGNLMNTVSLVKQCASMMFFGC